MPASPLIGEQRVLVFDTGPLLELVFYSAVHELRFASLGSALRHLRSHSSYQALSEFIKNFPRKTTTPHVVAEISSWISRTEPKGRSAIWGLVYREFSSMAMDEGVLKLLEMPPALVAEFGAVDAGILKLASNLGHARSTVLSIDGALIAECARAGVRAKHLWDVLSESSS